MTLILTAMTRRSVIQVADMRLTNVRTGQVEDESTAKMVAYAGRFVLSFAGPASMGREPTAQWMTRVLSGVQDPGEILGALAESAERIVKRYPPNIRGLAVVGAGWSGEPGRSEPIYIQLTNFEFESGALLPGFRAVPRRVEAQREGPLAQRRSPSSRDAGRRGPAVDAPSGGETGGTAGRVRRDDVEARQVHRDRPTDGRDSVPGGVDPGRPSSRGTTSRGIK